MSIKRVEAPILVVCLCAEWCGVCRDYRIRYEEVLAKFAEVTFVWLDVEDDADLLHPLDVEDFPTLLIAVGDEPRFFGPITPQMQTLERLVKSHVDNAEAPALADLDLLALVARIRTANRC